MWIEISKEYFFQVPGFSVVKIAGCTLYMRYIFVVFPLSTTRHKIYTSIYDIITVLVNGLPQSICKKKSYVLFENLWLNNLCVYDVVCGKGWDVFYYQTINVYWQPEFFMFLNLNDDSLFYITQINDGEPMVHVPYMTLDTIFLARHWMRF